MSSSRFAFKLGQMLYESWDGNGMPSDDLHLLSPGEVPPPSPETEETAAMTEAAAASSA